jgi:hypothetical protein
MKDKVKIKWFKEPQVHDYPAAKSYLSLIYDENESSNLVSKLRKAPITQFKAKDIFRASDLSLLGISNLYVSMDRKKVKKGLPISPILLVRDTVNGKVIIADGYHRLCAVYSLNEEIVVPCKIV